MANRPAPPARSKRPKGATHPALPTSGRKVQFKPNSVSKPDSLLDGSVGSVSAEKRRLMIAEAAYYLSERRGFGGGREMEDWLLAEKQIDATLSGETLGAQSA